MEMIIFILIILILVIAIVVATSKNKNQTKEEQVVQNNYSEADRLVARDYKIDSWGELLKIVIISGIFGVIGYGLSTIVDGANPISYTFFGAGFPWGYSVISKIIDDWVEFWAFLASGWAWFIVFCIKIALSLCLGAIIMPIKLILSLYHIIHAHNLSKEVNKVTVVETDSQNVKNSTEFQEQAKTENEETLENIQNGSNEFEKIKKLNDLLKQGILTQEEFDKKKQELLSKI